MEYPIGEVLSIPDADYRAIDAISQSGVRMYAKDGPYAYYCYNVARTHHFKVSDAMDFGRAGHRYFETGCNKEESFLIMPELAEDEELVKEANQVVKSKAATRLNVGDKLRPKVKTHIRYKELFIEAIGSEKQAISEYDLAKIEECGKAVYNSEVCRSILTAGSSHNEASIIREKHGRLFKCRADVLKEDRLIDYKFISKPKVKNPSDWKKEAKYDGSFYQALYYMEMFDRPKFTWILICYSGPEPEAFAVTVTRESLESDDSPLAQFCTSLGELRSIKSIADQHLQELVDCYVHDVWHPDSWYTESELEDRNW